MVFASPSFSFYFLINCWDDAETTVKGFSLGTQSTPDLHIDFNSQLFINKTGTWICQCVCWWILLSPHSPCTGINTHQHCRTCCLSRNWNFLEFPLEAVKLRYHHKWPQDTLSAGVQPGYLPDNPSTAWGRACGVTSTRWRSRGRETRLGCSSSFPSTAWVPRRGSLVHRHACALTASITTSCCPFTASLLPEKSYFQPDDTLLIIKKDLCIPQKLIISLLC